MEAPMDIDILRLPDPLTQMFSRHPIYDGIFSRISPFQLTRMSSVNRVIRTGVQDFSTRAYNVNRRLSHFVSDPLAFRSLMARTHMVISGSFTLQLFDRTYYPDSDLDLYVHPDRSIIEVGLYLEHDGYTYVPQSWQRENYTEEAENTCATIDIAVEDIEDEMELTMLYGMRSLRAVYTFERHVASDDVRKVQVIVPRVSPLASILDFHCTCVMNVITYNAAYSLYPYATFARREALVVNKESESEEALAKYSARGWRILANPSPLITFFAQNTPNNPLYAPWFVLNSRRWVNDRHSWVIPLDMTGVTPPLPLSLSSPHPGWDPVAECGWKLVSLGSSISVRHEAIKTTIFRWRYTVPDKDYLECLVPFFISQGKLEHRKIPSGGTRKRVAEIWTWWDYMLPLLREKYRDVVLEPGAERILPLTR